MPKSEDTINSSSLKSRLSKILKIFKKSEKKNNLLYSDPVWIVSSDGSKNDEDSPEILITEFRYWKLK